MSQPTRHRVVHVSQPSTEGVARVVLDLVTSQLHSGWHVTVACPESGALFGNCAAAGAQVLAWPATRSPGPQTVSETARLYKLVRRADPTIVHLHSAKAGLAGRLAVRGRLPTVYQPHAWSFLAVTGRVERASRAWERGALRWTDTLICVSEAEREQGRVNGLVLPDKAVVVPNGVDTDAFAPGDRARARRTLGLGDEPLVVCVGRLSRQKGQDVLLKAWPAVRAALPAARLVLVGDGPLRPALQHAAVPAVDLVGTADPLPWYQAADVVVLPSRWEGMALAPLEAGSCGRSVVATDVAGVRESVPGSTAGAVVAVEDHRALAEALAARLADPSLAADEGARARRHVLARYDVRVTAQRVVHEYQRALDRRHHSG